MKNDTVEGYVAEYPIENLKGADYNPRKITEKDFENLKGWLKTFVGSLDSDTAVSVSDTQQLIKYLKVYRQLPLVIHLVTMLSDLIERETQGKEVLADESCRCLVLN